MDMIEDLLRMRHGCGRSQREIGIVRGLSVGTVNRLLQRTDLAGLGWTLPAGLDTDGLHERLNVRPSDGQPDARQEALGCATTHNEGVLALGGKGDELECTGIDWACSPPQKTGRPVTGGNLGALGRPGMAADAQDWLLHIASGAMSVPYTWYLKCSLEFLRKPLVASASAAIRATRPLSPRAAAVPSWLPLPIWSDWVMLVFHPQMPWTQVSEALPKRHPHDARAASLRLFTFAGIRSWPPQSRRASRRRSQQSK